MGEKSEKHSGRLILTHIFALNPVWSEETHVKSTKSCLLPVWCVCGKCYELVHLTTVSNPFLPDYKILRKNSHSCFILGGDLVKQFWPMRLTESSQMRMIKSCEKKALTLYTCSLLSVWNEDVMAGVVKVIFWPWGQMQYQTIEGAWLLDGIADIYKKSGLSVPGLWSIWEKFYLFKPLFVWVFVHL